MKIKTDETYYSGLGFSDRYSRDGDEHKHTIQTADFPTICTLSYFGFDIESFERNPNSPSRIAVFFTHTPELDVALQSLRSRKLTVEPLSFLEITRTIKARLRDCI